MDGWQKFGTRMHICSLAQATLAFRTATVSADHPGRGARAQLGGMCASVQGKRVFVPAGTIESWRTLRRALARHLLLI